MGRRRQFLPVLLVGGSSRNRLGRDGKSSGELKSVTGQERLMRPVCSN